MRFNGQTDRREGGLGGIGEWQTDTATNGNENGGGNGKIKEGE